MPESLTLELLRRWHGGDAEALGQLLKENIPWLQAYLGQRIGPTLRRVGDTEDFLQDVVVHFLKYGPRFLISDAAQFRALLVRIAANVLRDEHDWITARRRSIDRECSLPSDSVLLLDTPRNDDRSPSGNMDRKDWEAWIRLGMELLSYHDRTVLFLRLWEDRSFAKVGQTFGVSEDAARMRFHRALARLADVVFRLRAGHLREVLSEVQEGEVLLAADGDEVDRGAVP